MNIFDDHRFAAEERARTAPKYRRGWRYYPCGGDCIFEEAAQNKVPETDDDPAVPAAQTTISAVPPPTTDHPTYEQRKFTCPRCHKIMILTREEYLTRTYTCPYCIEAKNYSVKHSSTRYYPSFYQSSSSRRSRRPATCARCGRYVDYPIYYGGLPYGSYCIRYVRGW